MMFNFLKKVVDRGRIPTEGEILSRTVSGQPMAEKVGKSINHLYWSCNGEDGGPNYTLRRVDGSPCRIDEVSWEGNQLKVVGHAAIVLQILNEAVAIEYGNVVETKISMTPCDPDLANIDYAREGLDATVILIVDFS